MTAILFLLVLAVVALVATMRTLRHDKPREAPRSHLEWSGGGLPSHPYWSSV